jgi:hypothetical protein
MQQVTSDILREALDAALTSFQKRLRGGALTADDLNTIIRIIASAGGVSVTVSDLADLYGQSETNVRSVIKRRITSHPKRRVYYNLLDFISVAPRKWHIRAAPSAISDN